jgi:hypothetical protein
MRKLLLLPIILLLVACGASGAEDTATDSADAAGAESTSPTSMSETVVERAPVEVSGDPITVANSPQEAGVVRDRDWSKGAEDPLVTIIEYGDFQ